MKAVITLRAVKEMTAEDIETWTKMKPEDRIKRLKESRDELPRYLARYLDDPEELDVTLSLEYCHACDDGLLIPEGETCDFCGKTAGEPVSPSQNKYDVWEINHERNGDETIVGSGLSENAADQLIRITPNWASRYKTITWKGGSPNDDV